MIRIQKLAQTDPYTLTHTTYTSTSQGAHPKFYAHLSDHKNVQLCWVLASSGCLTACLHACLPLLRKEGRLWLRGLCPAMPVDNEIVQRNLMRLAHCTTTCDTSTATVHTYTSVCVCAIVKCHYNSMRQTSVSTTNWLNSHNNNNGECNPNMTVNVEQSILLSSATNVI